MSWPRIKPRSIAARLILLFTPASALLFCGAATLLYAISIGHLIEEDDGAFETEWFGLQTDLKSEQGLVLVAQQLQAPLRSEGPVYWVRVVDAAGRTLAETRGMGEKLPASSFPSTAERTITKFHQGNLTFAVRAATVRGSGGPFMLQMAQDRTGDDRFSQRFALLLGLVLVLGVAAIALIATTVTRRALRPLAQLTSMLEQASPNRLHERIGVAAWPDELQPVARAFDEMLGRLETAFQRLTQLSADMAHELRTPVANIRGEAEVALTRSRDESDYRATLESAISECEKLSTIVERLLFLAQADAAAAPLQRTIFDGAASLQKIADYYEPIADEKAIQLTCHGKGEVNADPILFERAVSNLVDNALRHTPAGGRIELGISPGRSDRVTISVTDTGAGISADHLPRIFERFYRPDASRTAGGTGLGLAIVKSIVELHGGAVAIQSGEGGTRVEAMFPRAT